MIEYFIRRKSKLTFEIAKFDGTKAPISVYTVNYAVSTDTGKCNCFRWIQYRERCKHIEWITGWIQQGEPIPEALK